jgi:hypothetical protein
VRDSFVTCVSKTSLFQAIFEIFSTFLIFLWIVEYLNVEADVNAHLLMYRVSQPKPARIDIAVFPQRVIRFGCSFLQICSKFNKFCDYKVFSSLFIFEKAGIAIFLKKAASEKQ